MPHATVTPCLTRLLACYLAAMALMAIAGAQPAERTLPLVRYSDGRLNQADWSRERNLIALGGGGGVTVWAAETGEIIRRIGRAGHYVEAVAFAPGGMQLGTASWDGTARLWEVDTGRELRVFEGHTGFVRQLAFSADGSRLATASWDGTARVWDRHDGTVLALIEDHTDILYSVQFSSDGALLLTGSRDGSAIVHDLAGGAVRWRIESPLGSG